MGQYQILWTDGTKETKEFDSMEDAESYAKDEGGFGSITYVWGS